MCWSDRSDVSTCTGGVCSSVSVMRCDAPTELVMYSIAYARCNSSNGKNQLVQGLMIEEGWELRVIQLLLVHYYSQNTVSAAPQERQNSNCEIKVLTILTHVLVSCGLTGAAGGLQSASSHMTTQVCLGGHCHSLQQTTSISPHVEMLLVSST